MMDTDLSLRMCALLGLERKRMIKREKKARWGEYLSMSVPVIYVGDQNKEWVQRLKEEITNNLEL